MKSWILGALICGSSTISFGQQAFELIQEKDQIYVYSNPVKNRKTIEYRAFTLIQNTQMSTVLDKLTRYSEHASWLYNCEYSELLDQQDNTAYLYQVCDASWPFKDRDYVLELVKTVTQTNQTKISFKAIANKYPVQQGHVRLDQFNGYWLLEQVGTAVKVTIFCTFDPKLNMPRAFRRSYEKKIPFNTLKNLRAAFH